MIILVISFMQPYSLQLFHLKQKNKKQKISSYNFIFPKLSKFKY